MANEINLTTMGIEFAQAHDMQPGEERRAVLIDLARFERLRNAAQAALVRRTIHADLADDSTTVETANAILGHALDALQSGDLDSLP